MMKKPTREIVFSARESGGIALPLVLIVLVVVSIIGAGLLTLSMRNSVDAGQELSSSQAFWTAEAGLHAALAVGEANRAAGESEAFPGVPATTQNPEFDTPFIEGEMVRGQYRVYVWRTATNPPGFTILSEGVSDGAVSDAIQVSANQATALTAGLFGASGVTLKPNTKVYSFGESQVGGEYPYPPTAADSTGEAVISSNEVLDIKNPEDVDGTIMQGADEEGVPAELKPTDMEVEYVGYMDPDPLGLLDPPTTPGTLAYSFADAAAGNNDNDKVSAIDKNDKLSIANKKTVVLTSGNYYVTKVDMAPNSTLIIRPTTGANPAPVNLYLAGSFDCKPGGNIVVEVDPDRGFHATSFRIFGNAPGETINMQPNGNFSGFIYAPNMTVNLQPTGDFIGGVWAEDVNFQPNGKIFIDMTLFTYGNFSAYRLVPDSWRQLPR